MRGVLRLAPYRRLLAAYILNELAWAFSPLALSYLIYRRTGSALDAAAFFQGTLFVPALLTPAIVARVDRLRPRVILPVLYGLEAIAYLLLAVIAHSASVAIVLVVATLDGVIALTARSLARAATVSVTSPAGLLREGNALANTLFTICFMAGPGIAGAVIVAGGTTAVLLIDGGLFVLTALVLATAHNLPGAAPAHGPDGGSRVRAALAHVRERPMLRTLFVSQAALTAFFTISVPVDVVFAAQTLHTGAAGYGLLFSAWGGGAVAGSAVYARWRRLAAREIITLGSTLLGAGLVVMAAAPTLTVAIVGTVIGGVGNGIYSVAVRTAIQEAVEAPWMALTMSFNEAVVQFVPGIGILIGGVVAALATPRLAFAVAGLGALVLTAATWVMLRPPIRVTRSRIERPVHDQV